MHPSSISTKSAIPLTIDARYLIALTLGAAFASLCYFGSLALLSQFGRLPAPPIANSICVDEKLAFLREHRPTDSNLLVIGSSVAWRHFDSAVAVRAAPGTLPLNGGFCGLYANQSLLVAEWLLSHEPAVRNVIMIASPQDFGACADKHAAFDRGDADRYVFDHASRWTFYARYFDPLSLIRNTLAIARLRTDQDPWDAMVFTPYGDGPLDTDKTRDLVYGRLPGLDPVCFAAVRRLALELQGDKRRFMVVMTPINPEWKARYDAGMRLGSEFERSLSQALAGTDASYWNADREGNFGEEAFTDAIHLRWSSATRLSEMVVQRAGLL
jgi:hypothetical protein